ncbi:MULTISPECIES: prepilin peptidase [Vibrio]|uniref:A24 family peptidase n=1 Tax=Vibrio TaxID=662 RepID=UPI001FCAB88A|nr:MULTISPECIES: prepilin peptidase [Vibrio]
MGINFWWLIILATVLFYISYCDFRVRIITNKHCAIVTVIALYSLVCKDNFDVLPFSLSILIFGIALSYFSILGAGDSKLLSAISLAISPEYIVPIIFLIVFLGGALSLGYYIYGLMTDMEKVRRRGLPYGIPIVIGSLIGVVASL